MARTGGCVRGGKHTRVNARSNDFHAAARLPVRFGRFAGSHAHGVDVCAQQVSVTRVKAAGVQARELLACQAAVGGGAALKVAAAIREHNIRTNGAQRFGQRHIHARPGSGGAAAKSGFALLGLAARSAVVQEGRAVATCVTGVHIGAIQRRVADEVAVDTADTA